MDVGGAKRDVTLNVKIVADPTNEATLARMTAEVEAAKKRMSIPASISVTPGSIPGAPSIPGIPGIPGGQPQPVPPTFNPPGPRIPMPVPGTGPAVPGVGPTVPGGAAVVAGGWGLGGMFAGGAAVVGLGAAAYSAYDTFFGNRTLSQTGIGRVGGGLINNGKQFFADVGNFFTTSGDYFDPLGTAKAAKLDKRQAAIDQLRREKSIMDARDELLSQSQLQGDVYLANRNADAGSFSGMNDLDRSLYDNQRAQRMANLYGGNQEGLVRSQMELFGNRSAMSRAPQLTAIQNEIGLIQNAPQKTAENEQRVAELLERQRRLKMEIAQETIKSLEATRQERSERAQMIREEGMSQRERFGNLDEFQQQEIIDADQRSRAGIATVEDRRLLADYGGQETRSRLRDQALANAGAFPFADEFAREAQQQEKIAREIEVKIQEQKAIEVNVSFERDADGEETSRKIAEAVQNALDLREKKIRKQFEDRMRAAQNN